MREEIKKICLTKEANALKGLEILENNPQKIVLIVETNFKLIGTVTDGDIRRGLLFGFSLNEKLEKFMYKEFKAVIQSKNNKILVEESLKSSVTQIPIIDKRGILIDLISKNKNKKIIDTPVVIMAGGQGKRLRPLTDKLPKPMVKVNNQPILEIIINQFKKIGFINFYISVNYLKQKIIGYFGDGKNHGININYIEETHPLGTAGSLKLIEKEIKSSFILLNGDVLSKFNPLELMKFHDKNDADATICVRNHETLIPYGVITSKGIELDEFKEKPTFNNNINAGVYIINKTLLEIIMEDEFIDMPEVLMRAKNSGKKVILFPLHEYWLDIGLPNNLKEAENLWHSIENGKSINS